MITKKLCLVLSLSTLAALSAAQTHYVSQGNRLYKFKSATSVTSVQLKLNGKPTADFSSLAFDPAGALWGQSNGVLYKIDPKTGNLTKQWTLASGNGSNTFDFRIKNGVTQWIGFVYVGSSKTNSVVKKVAATGVHLGDYAINGPYAAFASSAYDPATGRYYAAIGASLKYFNVDVPSRDGVIVGPAPLTKAIQAGGAFYNGIYYLIYRNAKNGALFFTHWDKGQGKFVNDFSLGQSQIAYQDALGYAVAPN